MGIDSQVCFHRGLFSSLSNRERAPQGLWSHWMALIRICVVPNCSQPLSRPILWIVAVCATYWTHSTAVCFLMVGYIGKLPQTSSYAGATLARCSSRRDAWIYVFLYLFTYIFCYYWLVFQYLSYFLSHASETAIIFCDGLIILICDKTKLI